jgi:hypothetical protein
MEVPESIRDFKSVLNSFEYLAAKVDETAVSHDKHGDLALYT